MLKFGDLPGKQRAVEAHKQQAAFERKVKDAMAAMQNLVRQWRDNYDKHGPEIADERLEMWTRADRITEFPSYVQNQGWNLDVLREAARRLRESR